MSLLVQLKGRWLLLQHVMYCYILGPSEHDVPTHLGLFLLHFGTCRTWLCCRSAQHSYTTQQLDVLQTCTLSCEYGKIAMQYAA